MISPIPIIFTVNWNACIKCGACVAVCPQEAGFTSPFDTIAVDRPCHIACLLCQRVCPVSAITNEKFKAQNEK
ncbi:MAG TPA: ferredoxin [Anaerolineae bacterium]|nr:ferredoxin [Anaerolineae bacterium]